MKKKLPTNWIIYKFDDKKGKWERLILKLPSDLPNDPEEMMWNISEQIYEEELD